jgi:hypothetical protein
MLRLLRTIRFDQTDERVFPQAARPGEWAVSGAFAFADPAGLEGKLRQAFANGFLSVDSFGWSTFATVAGAEEGMRAALAADLARQCLERLGAPGMDEARRAAEAEIAFVADLCAEAPVNTVFAVSREVGDDGRVREAFRTVEAPQGPVHTRVWDVVSD